MVQGDSTNLTVNKAQFKSGSIDIGGSIFGKTKRSSQLSKTKGLKKENSQMESISCLQSTIKRDNRSVNPASPFRFNTKVQFFSNDERKKLFGTRYNKMYTEKTPHLTDPDIKARLPVKVETE